MKKMTTILKPLLTLTIALSMGLVSVTAQSAGKSSIHLDKANVNLSDKNSLQRGAKTFVNYCLSCHSASYMRFEHMSTDLGIDKAVVEKNMLFAGNRIGDLMKVSMNKKDAAAYFGKAPPDLSTITRLKKPDYIYSFLKGFYVDPATPTGWNNKVFAKTAMPHVLYPLQGDQKVSLKEDDHGGLPALSYEHLGGGTQTPEEYDATVRDLVNFLVYLGEPAKLKRYSIGFWVLCFLGFLAALLWYLKLEYWRDVH